VRDPVTGQYLAKSFQDKYPTGRKHCSKCKRWRHIIDFTVNIWTDSNKTFPLELESRCRGCRHKPHRIREKRCVCEPPRGFDPDEFVRFLKPEKRVTSRYRNKSYFVNGKRLTYSETRALLRWKTGEIKRVRLKTADAWAIRFDLPLWELEDSGKMAL
jgi:hypothetical protein